MNTSTPSGFGSMGNTTSTTTNQGTGNPSYTPTQDKESGAILSSMSIFHSISAMPAYKNWSYEELRFADYGLNKKHAGTATGGGFGSSAFGSTMQAPSAFGATSAPQSNAFGSMGTNTGFGGFGASTTPAFGSQAQVTQAGSVFGAPTSTPAFGASTGAFGQAQATPFGQKPATSTSWGNLFCLKLGSQPAGSTFGATPAFGNQPAPAAATSSWGKPLLVIK
jgi:nuclear pore complex protein Nup98-Nup96